MEYIITPIWTLLELYAVAIFADSLMQRHHNKKRVGIVFFMAWALGSTCLNLGASGIVKILLNIGITFEMLTLVFCGSWLRRLLCTILSWILLGLIDTAVVYGFCAILQISYTDLVWKKLLYVAVVTLAKFLGIFIVYLFWRMRKQIGAPSIKRKWLLLTLIFPMASLLMAAIVFVSFRTSDNLTVGAFVFSCVLAVANWALLYLIRIMEVRGQEELQLILMRQQMEIQTQNIHALEKSYRAQRKASHEFMHQMQTIHDLLEGENSQVAKDYILEIQKTHTTRTFAVNTHHPIIDAVLNHKHQIACEQNIDMRFHVNDLSAVSIRTDELVILLSNLLDNALEACQNLSENRIIECNIEASDILYLSIRNKSLPVTINDGHIETTKESKTEHGFGLPNICSILDMLKAEYAFTYSSGWFHFVAEIPFQNEPKTEAVH